MHEELRAVFDEHQSPTHCDKRTAHEHAAAGRRAAAVMLQQIAEYKTRIAEAEFAPHDVRLDGKLELMHQTFGAIERDVQAALQFHREIAKHWTQLDRYMLEWRADLDAFTSANNGTTSAPA